MKQDPSYCLYFVFIGTESLTEFITHEKDGALSISPFSREMTWKTKRFNEQEIVDLFTQFAVGEISELVNHIV
jgi:hypothetical protein